MKLDLGRYISNLLFIMFIFISGCTEIQRTDLVEEGILTVKAKPSQKIKILWHDAHEEDNKFVVSGVLQQFGMADYGTRADVQITVISPDGNILDKRSLDNYYIPKKLTGEGVKWRKFKVSFPKIPPEGSRVEIKVK